MLTECFPKIGECRFVRGYRAFLHSVWYTALIVLLMALANLFSLELPVYYIYLLLALSAVLLDDDLRALIPIVLCCYMTVSDGNNPATRPPKEGVAGYTPSAFYDPAFMLQLWFVAIAIVAVMAVRLVTILLRGEKKKVPALALGFGALGLSYVLAGLFSGFYGFRTALFGFVEIAALCAPYFLFYYGVDWRTVRKEEFAVLLTLVGCGVVLEVFGMYLQPISAGSKTTIIEEMLSGKEVNRGVLVTGWGMYNNVGCVLAICTPAPLYLAAKRKRGPLYILLSVLLLTGIVFSQSRGSMLFGGVAFALGVAAMLVVSKGRRRVANAVTIGSVAALLAVVLTAVYCVPAFKKPIEEVFQGILEQGLGDNGRWEIYRKGLEQFRQAPFFGVGFYQCNSFQWGAGGLPADFFLPPRYHDTYIQLLASGGVFALSCYLLHRLETVALFLRHPTAEKVFIAVCIAALLLTSITDCHFFNFGPGILYGGLLAFAEGADAVQAANVSAPQTDA